MNRLPVSVALAVLSLCACSGSSGNDGGMGGGSSGGGTATGGGSSTGGGSATGGGTGTGGGSAGGTGGGGGGLSAHCAGDGGFFGESKCDCAGFSLCDDFEAGSLDTATWTLDSSNGTASIDTTKAARGGKSLKIHIGNSGGDRAILNETKSFPAPMNHFWVRAFVWADGPVPQNHTAMFESSDSHIAERVGLDNGGLVKVNYLGPSVEYGVFNGLTPTPWPTGRWACFEIEYDGPHNAMHTWLDSNPLTEIDVDGTESPPWTAATYSTFSIGPELFQQEQPAGFDFWLDSVATSGSRITCSR